MANHNNETQVEDDDDNWNTVGTRNNATGDKDVTRTSDRTPPLPVFISPTPTLIAENQYLALVDDESLSQIDFFSSDSSSPTNPTHPQFASATQREIQSTETQFDWI